PPTRVSTPACCATACSRPSSGRTAGTAPTGAPAATRSPTYVVVSPCAEWSVGPQGKTSGMASDVSIQARSAVSLDDRYVQESGEVFLSGIQALVRMLLDQHRADVAAGRRTAVFASGYPGSPLGGFDRE